MDGWLCGDCKSLNTPRANSCYSCNVPRRFGEAAYDPESLVIVRTGAPGDAATGLPSPPIPGDSASTGLPPGAAAASAAAGPRPTVADARSSRARSRVLLVLLVATTAWTALSTSMVLTRGGTLGLVVDLVTRNDSAISALLAVGLMGSLLTIATAIAWFAWFDRVLRNVPALTGQWPDSGRISAIGWWLVPVAGFIKAPRIVGDVYNRLSVEGTPGLWLLALWALTWIGGTVGPSIATRIAAYLPFGLEVYLGLSDLITLLGQACYVAAGVFAVAMVTSIEHASAVRMTGGGAAVAPPTGVTPSDERFAAALRSAAEANAIVKVTQLGHAGAGAMFSAAVPVRDADADGGPLLRHVQRPPDSRGAANAAPLRLAGAAGARSIIPAVADTAPRPAAGLTAIPDAFGQPAEGRRAAVPRWAIGMAVMAVVLAVVGGAIIAGPRGEGPRDLGSVLADGLEKPTPPPTLPRPVERPTPAPTTHVLTPPSPDPAIAAADRLATSTYAEMWTGRIVLEAVLKVGDKPPITWTLAVARAGDTEWSRSRIDAAATGITTTETVVLARMVWDKVPGVGWEHRARGFGDQPTEPLFGVRDAGDLDHQRSFREDGRLLHEFTMTDASDLLALGFLHAVGAGSLERTVATVVADDEGRPVRATLTYGGSTRAGKAKLVIDVSYADVGGTFTIGSPRDGDPVVD